MLFGTSGIRGAVDSFLTNQFCFDIGRTFAIFLNNHQQKGEIVLGMDPRESSPRILNFIGSGLVFEGRKVANTGYCPVPAINSFLLKSSAAGGVMITGSHIKKELNGLKFFAFREEILKESEREIEKIYHEIQGLIPFKDLGCKLINDRSSLKIYHQLLVDLADKPYPQWKIVVDPGNGGQAEFIDKVLFDLGLKPIMINNSLEEGFLSRDTETDGAFPELQNLVIKEKADFGVAFDSDGDRIIFIDERGNFVPGDYTGSLIAKNGQTKVVVTPINSSQVVEYLNKPVIRTKVGSPYVVKAMKDSGASFGFEANGGGISTEVMVSRDGGSCLIKVLNLLKNFNGSFSSLVGTLPKFFLYRTKVDCPRELNEEVIKKAKNDFKGIKIEELDGLKIWIDKTSWILFRPSSNASEFRVFTEAKSTKIAKKLEETGIALVNEVLNKKLP